MSNNRKEEIVLTTFELAAQKGLANVTMSMIANKIGIKKPSLYKHFDSKDKIVEAMYQFLREQAKKKADIKPIDYSMFFIDKTALEVLQSAVQGYEVHKMLHFKNPDMSAVSFAMTIHGLMDYEMDKSNCECKDEADKDLLEEYLKWFCEENAVWGRKRIC